MRIELRRLPRLTDREIEQRWYRAYAILLALSDADEDAVATEGDDADGSDPSATGDGPASSLLAQAGSDART